MRKLIIALMLSLLLTLTFSSVANAYDVEDPCVADNKDFLSGGGMDFDSVSPFEYYYGELWAGGSDGYNLYRDDVTDTGNLDTIYIWASAPDKVDLPWDGTVWVGYYHMTDESPDTWYWSLEPRGWNYSTPELAAGFRIILPGASAWFPYCGFATAGDIDFSDGTIRIVIPKGTRITYPNGIQVGQLKVDGDGNIVNGITFSGGEVTITRM